jgi:hypothetical protein
VCLVNVGEVGPLLEGVPYRAVLSLDLDAAVYGSLQVLYGDGRVLIDLADLSQYALASEPKDFDPGTEITVEAENLWLDCSTDLSGQAPRVHTVAYDEVEFCPL